MGQASRLPPLDILFWGTTNEDISLAHAMTQHLRAQYRVVYLQRDNDHLRVVEVEKVKANSTRYKTVSEAWENIFSSCGQSAVIKLNNCKVLPDALQRLYQTHIDSASPSSEASFYPTFTDAVFTFNDLSKETVSNADIVTVGPQYEDFRFYTVEHFDTLFAEPQFLSIDLTRRCNKRCDKCMYHSPRTPFAVDKNESMPLELVKSILSQASKFNRKPNIHPFLSGEPFLYEHFSEYLTAVNDLGLKTSITTNGILLTKKNIELLKKDCISSITISLDSMNSKRYERLQSPGGLDTVVKNIHNLLDARAKFPHLKINLTFVAEESNEIEFDAYLDYWLDKVDLITKAQRTNNFADRYPYKGSFIKNFSPTPCPLPWTCMCIRPSGKLSLPCAYEVTGTSESDTSTTSLLDIWRSPELQSWRNFFINENKKKYKFCQSCLDANMHSKILHYEKYTCTYSATSVSYQKAQHNSGLLKNHH